MRGAWAYIILIGIALIVIGLFVISYYPIAIFGTTLVTGGLAVLGVNMGGSSDNKAELLTKTMNDNLELAFRTYDKRNFYRIFVPSSLGQNGMLMLEKFPINIDKVERKFIQNFNGVFGVFMETPATILIQELRRSGISMTEDAELILKKGMTELYKFCDDVKVEVGQSEFNVTIVNPKPSSPIGAIGFIQALIVASIIAERESKISFIKKQEMRKGNLVLDVRVYQEQN
ncbi:hypothetical protein [Sulfuracidifex tepidarius]|uniref:Uncharacterized protein n=1 Tax=Sulfuracidifex tepidarius TaxID=1294262 RepID=A0A510E541_9CREN|nr:hypothetical protein [Sulfuracidifex tepidarius]BBG24870.1 hypothetical protein IC006_2204 [Sulfuracidifex tepidarius]BBG27655.1 hypothetical protein IC007_2209 [Sulfuracidifex tepidarius]